MLKRNADYILNKWKDGTNKKCLLVRGARQVGKTFSVENFGRSAYESCITINFLKNPGYKRIFAENLDPKTLLLNISVYIPDAKLIPEKTLIFLDEIQECPEAITSLKFWNEDKRYDVIASGSMLGIDYKRPTSFPVGAIEYLDMTSLSFKEFLWATGLSDEVIGVLMEAFQKKEPVPLPIHERIMQLLRLYAVLGGMPEVLTLYFQEENIMMADEKQRAILRDYRYDIAHYASSDMKAKAEACYFSLPDQLSKENHKFQYSVVENKGTARKFETSLDWLEGAYLIHRVSNLNGYDLPLRSSVNSQSFRVYPTDIGLLFGMYSTAMKEMMLYPEKGKKENFRKGGLYEALIADMLIKNGYQELFFRKDETSTFEVEFMIETKDGPVPIEVKSANSKSKSLDNILKREDIPYGYKLIDGNVGIVDKKITLPLYMAMFL